MGLLTELGLSAIGVSALFVLMFLFGLIFICLAVTFFTIKAVALYKMAKATGVKGEWMAFVPLLSLLISGRLADVRRQEKSGKKPCLDKSLIITAAIAAVFIIISIISLTVSLVSIIFAADAAASQNVPLASIFAFPVVQSAVLLVITAIVLFVYKIQRTIALYNILCLFQAKSEVLKVTVCFIFPFLAPFFLLSAAKRKKAQ